MVSVIKKWLRSTYDLLMFPLGEALNVLPDRLFFVAVNAQLFMKGSPARFSASSRPRAFVAQSDNLSHYFLHRDRGRQFYAQGLKARAKQIGQSYCLDHIDFVQNDVVVDCGANTADLFLYLAGKISAEQYITFEPAPREHLMCQLNVPKARHFNLGLGDEPGVVKFYMKSDTADSSVIQPSLYEDVIDIKVTTLDAWLSEYDVNKIKLLKLEAEGFEPEILAGASSFLARCEYVAIDGGYERGVNAEQTFTTQTNILASHGFRLVDANFKWIRALFVNANL